MASTEHCLACFETLDAHLHRRKPLSLQDIQATLASSNAASSNEDSSALKDPSLQHLSAAGSSSSSSSTSLAASTPATSTSSLPLTPTSAPLFVTWNTVDDDDDDSSLRGCIGTFEAQDLSEGLAEYALISALHDTRFSPIRKSELRSLEVAVTLLTDFEEVDDCYDWEIGVHGIRLSFYDKGRRYGSTYLPNIASDQGWTKDETLFSLVRKAGWVGGRGRWKDLDLKVTRYQGQKKSMLYDEFKKWRESHEE